MHLPGLQRKRRFVIGRVLLFLFLLALPVFGIGMALGHWINAGGDFEANRGFMWLLLCGAPLLIPLLMGGIGARAYREFGPPLANVMAAADALAEGDLGVRVPVEGSGEFRRLAESFNRMAEELERADQQRRNLTADVAHELRTPIHILQGNLEGVLDGVYEPTADQIEVMLDETRLLSRLVDDLQILSLAEAGQLRLKLEEVNISELLTDVSTSFCGQAEAAGVRLVLDIPEDKESMTISADAERLDQVVSNLVANALRYTPDNGRITLSASTTPSGVQILVGDNGEGIAPEDLPYIFERFYRGDRSRSRSSGAGSGLGLPIARQLVRAHGGDIQVESEIGRGTTFTINLPSSVEVSESA